MYGPQQRDSKVGAMSVDDLEAYRRAVEQHAIVAITDRRGKIVYVNDLFCRISGFSREQLLGSTHRLVNSAHHPPEFWREVWGTIAAGRVWRGEICNRARDGSIYWVDSTIVPLTENDGQFRGYMAVRHPITALKRARDIQKGLEQRDAFKESVLNSVSYAVIGTGPDSMIAVFNRGAEELLGFRAQDLIGKRSIEALCDPHELQTHSEGLRRLRDEPGYTAFESEWTFLRKDGTRVPVFVSLTAMRDRDGRFLGRLGVAHDISARKRAEQALRESEQKFRSLFELSPVGVALNDLQSGRFLQVNDALARSTGYTREELLRMTYRDATSARYLDADSPQIKSPDQTPQFGPYEKEYRRKDGSTYPVLVSGILTTDASGRTVIWSIVQDIAQRKAMESKLAEAARRDKLTGLANRALFMERLEKAVLRVRMGQQALFAVLFLDFDHFKLINDTLGHGAGDELLRQIARRLQRDLRASDALTEDEIGNVVSRFGGDEFLLLINDLKAPDDAIRIAERLLNALAPAYDIQGSEVHSSASIGIITSEQCRTNAEDVVRNADVAMYEAKRAGRACSVVFNEAMRTRLTRHVTVENSLRRALDSDELYLVYQPIVELSTGRLVSAEALVRWNHPTLGPITPSEFIPIAEESGLIVALGQWVQQESCRAMVTWRKQDPHRAPKTISVNMSRAELALDQRLIAQLSATLKRAGLPADCLQLEVTEREVMRHPEASLEMMHEIKRLGIKIAMDDFGTGTSSLGFLRDYPFDTVKIDRSFVKDLTASHDVLAVIHATINLVENLGMASLAEGIEEPAQVAILQSLGCRFGQGYLFSRPVPAERLLDSVASRTPALALSTE